VATTLTQHEFSVRQAEGFNRIPVARTLLADTDTPLSAYAKLAQGPRSFMFESVEGGERWGRYSIIGLPAKTWLTVEGYVLSLYTDGERVECRDVEDPLEEVERYQQQFMSAPAPELPVFHGGLVGYFGYDTVRYTESKLMDSCPPDELNVPDIFLVLAEEVLIFDGLRGTLTVVVNADATTDNAYEAALTRLDKIEAELTSASAQVDIINLEPASDNFDASNIRYRTQQSEYEAWVGRVREYIFEGEVLQVVPSQRLSLPFSSSPLSLYRALRNLNPSPYMYFLDLDGFEVIGSSPEILVRLEEGLVTVRPIAGTRKRGATEEEDQALEADLLADQKEIAEHLMLIDLGRNDVGRVSEPGSVTVTENMVIERYSHVMHIVSNVTGAARSGMSAMDTLRAALPAGTLSGAPKVRAMEIIDELEPVKRGIYGGAVGYLSWSGNMDTAIAIRTVVVKDGEAILQAGAGIVADSVPTSEWEETLNKARAMLRAADMAAGASTSG
jgi:anthranilate synthase component 1